MTPTDDIFRNGVTLLAFVLAFYALVARERKTPYMVHAVYRISLVVLLALLLAVLKTFIPEASSGNAKSWLQQLAPWLHAASNALLGFGVVHIVWRLWKDGNRHIYFRDDQLVLNTTPGRWWLAFWRFVKRKKEYKFNPTKLSDGLVQSLKESSCFTKEEIERALTHHAAAPELSLSAVFEIPSLVEIDTTITDIASRFLKEGCFVQYTTCIRHPIEFLMQLESRWASLKHGEDWKKVSKRIVVVDAFTPHFGFTDSVYPERKKQAADKCLAFVDSPPSYAGIHTALARAFNKIRDADHREVRSTTLVIYEGCAALIDLESSEQYRIFVRHVLPSERLWGGMFSLFIEPTVSDDDRPVLKGAADIYVSPPCATANPGANQTLTKE